MGDSTPTSHRSRGSETQAGTRQNKTRAFPWREPKVPNPQLMPKIKRPTPKGMTARDIIRRHLRLERLTIKGDLSRVLSLKPQSAASLMTKKFPLTPHHIEAIVRGLKLDDFDAYELRRQAAIEAGWRIDLGHKL